MKVLGGSRENCGVEVPFTRPAALCTDDAPHLPVMQHAVAWMRDEQRYEPDWGDGFDAHVAAPTAGGDIVRVHRAGDAIAEPILVVSVDEMPAHFHPMRAITIDNDGGRVCWSTTSPSSDGGATTGPAESVGIQRGNLSVLAALLWAGEPNGETAWQRAVSRLPHGHNIDDDGDWAGGERSLSNLA